MVTALLKIHVHASEDIVVINAKFVNFNKHNLSANCDKACINGICIDTNKCECYYGWTGIDCTTPIKYPFCINGKPGGVDMCPCEIGWDGDLCEVRTCDGCNNGVCNNDGSCICTIDLKSSDPENKKFCDEVSKLFP